MLPTCNHESRISLLVLPSIFQICLSKGDNEYHIQACNSKNVQEGMHAAYLIKDY